MTGAGIACALGTPVGNTVLWGNTPSDVSQCTVSTTAYVGATGLGNVSLTGCAVTDTFVGASDFRLATTTMGAQARCMLFDKGAPPAAALKVPAHDLNGVSRPQRTQWDIGAYEAP